MIHFEKENEIRKDNRGMYFETLLNRTNDFYRETNVCLVYKKPTPIKIIKTKGNKIIEAAFLQKSTTDYNGVYKGQYIDFEAKMTDNDYILKQNIKKHQQEHLTRVQLHEGISFLLIFFLKYDRCFYLPSHELSNCTSKITIEDLLKFGYEVEVDHIVHYIEIIEKIKE